MKFKFGSFVTDGKGKLGGQVVSKNSRGNYLKTKVSASNPQSPRQLAVRANFLTITKAWSLLSEENRRQWIIASESYPQKDRIGTTFYLSGFGLFTQVNMVRLNLAQSMLSLPGSNPVFPQWQIVDIQCFSLSSGIWLFFNPTIPDGYRIQVYATDLVSVGLNRAHGIYKLIGYVSPGQTYPFNLYSLWNGIFNKSLQSGKRIIFKLALVHVVSGFISQFGVFNSDIIEGNHNSLGLSWSSLGQQFAQQLILSLQKVSDSISVAGTGTGGLILRSTNVGTSFSSLGQQAAQGRILCFIRLSNGVLLAGTFTQGHILRSTNDGLTWSDLGQQYSQLAINSFVELADGTILASTQGTGLILRSVDNGLTWSSSGQLFGLVTVSKLCSLPSGLVLAAAPSPCRLLSSSNGGLTWSLSSSYYAGGGITSISYIGGGVVIVLVNGGGLILKSTNSGKTFTLLSGFFSNLIGQFIYSLGSGFILVGTFSGGRIFRSVDFGLTWSDLGQQFSQNTINCFERISPSVVLAGTQTGGLILRSTY